ncbi:MAG: hypothetical protein ABW198_03255 [Pseudorhodoplanes sp.]
MNLVVGITGHRAARLKDENRKRIRRQLAEVFVNIEESCEAELVRQREFYKKDPPCLRLVSSLADGADADALLECPKHWLKVGLLPSPFDQYRDLLKRTARPGWEERAAEEFEEAHRHAQQILILPPLRGRDVNGLGRSRDLLLRQIDILVAVWDGAQAEHAGGTADVVERATEAGIPVIWIATEKEQPPWVITRVTDAIRDTPMADATTGAIADVVRREVGVSGDSSHPGEAWNAAAPEADSEDRLRNFLQESVPEADEEKKKIADPLLAAFEKDSPFGQRISDILQPRFVAADRLATKYARRYRLAYVSAYLLSAISVLSAVLSFLLFGHNVRDAMPGEEHVSAKLPSGEIWLAALEFTFVTAIVAIVLNGLRGGWHDRWLDYRALAETLRHLRFLAPLGQYEKRSYLEAAARPGATWILWYFRATIRELGLPAGDLGPDYQRKILRAIIPGDLDGQIKYHAKNLKLRRRQQRIWHWAGNSCFCVALATLVTFLGVCWLAPHTSIVVAPYVTAITAFFPALGAACAGIRFTGDFEGDAERSAQTGTQLGLLRLRYEVALDRLDFDHSTSVVFETARIMATDINGWSSMYSRKQLCLPG